LPFYLFFMPNSTIPNIASPATNSVLFLGGVCVGGGVTAASSVVTGGSTGGTYAGGGVYGLPLPSPELDPCMAIVTAELDKVGCEPSVAVKVHVPVAGAPLITWIYACEPTSTQFIEVDAELLTPHTTSAMAEVLPVR
jgi:hypothetical protein